MKNRLYPAANGGALKEARQYSSAGVHTLVEGIADRVAEYPKTSLLVMATLGAIVGWFLKRR